MANSLVGTYKKMREVKEELDLYVGRNPFVYEKPVIKHEVADPIEAELKRIQGIIDDAITGAGGHWCPVVEKYVLPHSPDVDRGFRRELRVKGHICTINQNQHCHVDIADADDCFKITAAGGPE